MAEKQTTITRSVSVEGTGLHTGQQGKLTFHPAKANHGVKFRRIDLEGKPVIDALIENVVDTSRGTTIGVNNVRIYTIEHVLATLTGFGIDNVLIDLDMEEIPIKDGSAYYFVKALEEAGSTTLDAKRDYIVITEEIKLVDEEKGFEMSIMPADNFMLDVEIDYGTEVLNVQHASLTHIKDFKTEIAPCRTFVFLHELEYLLQNNLIKGGDLSNAIVFVNRKVSQQELDRLAELFEKPKVKVKDEGILNNLDLHFENEPARHKLLDIIGDLSLLGKPIKGHVKAKRPGHFANTQFARLIKEKFKNIAMNIKPPFDIFQPPVIDIMGIQKIIPHILLD